MQIVVVGLGQSLRGDDAAGLEAVRLWQRRHPQTAGRVQLELAGLPGLGLLDLLEGAQAAVLVDAVHSQAAAGTILRIGPDELAAFTPGSASAHGWGVAETLALGRSLQPWLKILPVTLVGIVGRDFSLGAGFSPQVQAALEPAAERIEIEVTNLLSS